MTPTNRPWSPRTWPLAVVLLLSACTGLGPPPMEPVTAKSLAEAEHHWQAHGSDSYHLVVRVRPPRVDPVVYDLVVDGGRLVSVVHEGRAVRPEDIRHNDYSVSGLFALLHEDLRLADVPAVGDTPPVDLRARFEPETGRLVRYRRTVGSARRRVLMIEVLDYQARATDTATAPPPSPAGSVSATRTGTSAG